MLPGFETVYVRVIAFNGHAKPCVHCHRLEPRLSENVPNFKRTQEQLDGCVFRRRRV